MPGLFITATGTDIGKTYVTAGLLRAGRRAGIAVDALKPVLSGYDPADAETSDAGVLLAALDRPITAATVAAMSPWRFAAPLSPDMAAEREGRVIDMGAVATACRAAITNNALTLIEGVGGVMVPLDRENTILDLMAALALPVLLVTGSYVGAISHGLTALTALTSRGIEPAMVILNETAGSTVPLAATADTLRRFHPTLSYAVIARTHSEQRFDELFASVRTLVASSRACGSAA